MTGLSDQQADRLRDLIDHPDLSGTRYDLVDKIAVGGMGTVYRAHDRELEREVALKVLTIPDDSGEMALRMIREARIVAGLEHPSIIPIHDVGRLPDGRVYYTMKLIVGQTLEEYRSQTDSRPHLLRLFQRVCEAIEFAHARGVIHRDLKPSNVMVGPFGEVLVMDWGIAARLKQAASTTDRGDESSPIRSSQDKQNQESHSTTAHGTILGTPSYMPPEQAEGRIEELDHRSDVYALGAVLSFVITGHPPVTGNDSVEVLKQVIDGAINRPRDLVANCPRRLEAVCLKAMQKDPSGRYPSARALEEDIAAFLDDEPVSAYRENWFESASRWVGRHRLVVFIILTYVIVRFIILFLVGT